MVFSIELIYNYNMFAPYAYIIQNKNFILTFKFLGYMAYFFVPLFIGIILWELWIQYKRAKFFAEQKYILLEIKLPREIFKSPKAAEFFINGLSQGVGEGNWYEMYWHGRVRPWFSLEIVSIDGGVHFFIWTRKGYKNQIEANIYSQYPGIEVFEVPDYTLPVSYDPTQNVIFGTEFELTREDVFPIKTYVDYGMDKDPKEEYKIDPLTPLIEFLGNLDRGMQMWIQIIIRQHKAEHKDPVTGKMVDKRWKNDAQVQIDKILKAVKGETGPDGKIIPGTGRPLSDVERETIKALDRSVSKTGFDVGMRAIYFAPKEVFNGNLIGGMIGGITHFNSHMNGFKPARISAERLKHFLLLWKKRSDKVRNAERQEMFDAYKKRAWFYKPHKRPHFVLNTEELATLFHFPGGVSTTPTFARVDSRKAEAPPNIPV